MRWSRKGLYRYSVGLEHESNGEDGTRSRAWNNVFFEAELAYPILPGLLDEIRLRPRLWWITPLQDGRDHGLDRDIGYWRLGIELRTLGKAWGGYEIDALVAAGSRWDRGRLMVGAMYDPWITWMPGIYFQLFHGYGETLVRSTVKSTEYRLGVRLVEY
jgi:phospholipase A1